MMTPDHIPQATEKCGCFCHEDPDDEAECNCCTTRVEDLIRLMESVLATRERGGEMSWSERCRDGAYHFSGMKEIVSYIRSLEAKLKEAEEGKRKLEVQNEFMLNHIKAEARFWAEAKEVLAPSPSL